MHKPGRNEGPLQTARLTELGELKPAPARRRQVTQGALGVWSPWKWLELEKWAMRGQLRGPGSSMARTLMVMESGLGEGEEPPGQV